MPPKFRPGRPEASALSEPIKAYLAGIIDGEGSIGIYKRAPIGHNYFLKLSVTNTSKAVIDWTQEQVGGANVFHRPVQPKQHRPTYTWSAYGRLAADVITAVRPYLIIKTAQADLGLAFIGEYIPTLGRSRIDPMQIQRREWFHQRSMELNRPHLFVAAAETKREGTVA